MFLGENDVFTKTRLMPEKVFRWFRVSVCLWVQVVYGGPCVKGFGGLCV